MNKKYIVCFDFYDEPNSLRKPDFRSRMWGHVFIIKPISKDYCLILDKQSEGIEIHVYTCVAEDLAIKLSEQGRKCYEVYVGKLDNKLQDFFSCTGFCKKILNIKKFWIITPRQLWRQIHGKNTEL